jgi:hypothetical protein
MSSVCSVSSFSSTSVDGADTTAVAVSLARNESMNSATCSNRGKTDDDDDPSPGVTESLVFLATSVERRELKLKSNLEIS